MTRRILAIRLLEQIRPGRKTALVCGLFIALALPMAALADQTGSCGGSTGCFGMAFTGSPFFPPGSHDQSTNAKDNIVPRTMTVSQGQSVSYQVNGMHWPAVYRVGIDDEDINTTSFPAPGCPTGTRVDDPNGRLWESSGCLANGTTFTIPASTFAAPGKYLIICQVHPHFLNGMYGWINVQ